MVIPKIIHQIWIGDLKFQKKKFIGNINSWKSKNPSYTYLFHDNSRAKKLLSFYPKIKKIYNNLLIPVQKADLLRYLIIYHYGGFYADLDTFCKKSLDKTLQKRGAEMVFGIDKIPGKHEYIQWCFGCISRQNLLLEIIEEIRRRVHLTPPNIENLLMDKYTYWLTGPQVFTKVMDRYFKNNPHKLRKTVFFDHCTFGNYLIKNNKKCFNKAVLVHNYDGIWKKMDNDKLNELDKLIQKNKDLLKSNNIQLKNIALICVYYAYNKLTS